MVILKCKLSKETRETYTPDKLVCKICSCLAGEPAYVDNEILVSGLGEDGYFRIILGGDVNKDNLILEATL